MPHFKMRSTIVALAFLVLAQSALGQKVNVKYNKAANFSKFKTYTWVRGIPARNPIVNQMITDAIDRELAARGLTKKEADGDIQILFTAATEFDLQAPPGDWGNTSLSSQQTGIATRGQAYDVRKGTLLVDMLETSTKNIVWRGSASETLTHSPSANMSKDAQRVEKLIKRSVAKMFRKYPAAVVKK